MADVDVLANRASEALRALLARLGSLVAGLAVIAALIGLAAYGSGLLASDGDVWPVGGLLLCLLPATLAALAWWRLRTARRLAPRALHDIRGAVGDSRARPAMDVLIDYDTGQQVVVASRSFGSVMTHLHGREAEWPTLVRTVRTIATVPLLVVLAIVGMLGVGLLGTVLLIVGLID